MIAELYANMCGTELWNRARLARYMANGVKPPRIELKCAPCEGLEDLIPCIEDQPPDESDESDFPFGYELPELDPAPWYDPGAPESANFAGMLVLETSLSSVVDRRMVQNIGHGATLTRLRYSGRTLSVRALLIGKTCCSVDYGFKWLTQALLGDFCDSCDGCTLTFLTCAPSTMTDVDCLILENEFGERVPYYREFEDDEYTRGSDFARQMFGAGLLQGPEITQMRGTGGSCTSGCSCAAITEVEFTIGIGNPWMYKVEELVIEDQVLTGCPDDDCGITFVECTDPSTVCPEPTDCDEDPDCTNPPIPPPSGMLPLQQCGCIPLYHGRSCFAVPADLEWFDQALIIEISAGSGPLRNLQIHAWQNPLELECCLPQNEAYFDECNACATLLVGYVPAFGTLRFDSATREVTITCNNVTRPAAKNIATIEGLPFEWIEIGCQPACIGIDIDCYNTAEDASVTAWRVGREL